MPYPVLDVPYPTRDFPYPILISSYTHIPQLKDRWMTCVFTSFSKVLSPISKMKGYMQGSPVYD